MKASLGIEVNHCVVEKLIIVQAAEVMLSQLHNIQLPSRWIHTPHVLHHSDQKNCRLEEGVELQLTHSSSIRMWRAIPSKSVILVDDACMVRTSVAGHIHIVH